MYGYIYKTTNLVTSMIYIGRHMAEAFEPDKYIGSGTILKRAINKYGVENFKCELIETAESKEELNKKERYWIAKYRNDNPGLLYNITAGGEAVMEGLRKIECGDETKLVQAVEVSSYLEAGWKLSALENRKKQRKEWKQKHPDRVRAAKNKWNKAHPENIKVNSKHYYNTEQGKAKQLAANKKWASEHPEKVAEQLKRYRQKNKEAYNAYHRAYWAKKKKEAK